MTDEKPWRDEELMRELYHDKRMSQREISDHFGNEITPGGVGYCLDELGIEKRSRSEAARIRWLNEHLVMYTHRDGYELITPRDRDDRLTVFMHRLLAVHKYGFEEVKDKVVHHENHIPWDNRPENLELMTAAEHTQHHHESEFQYGKQSAQDH